MTYQECYDRYKDMVETRLLQYFTGKGLEEVMRYSLLAGGKRLRPVLTLAFCEAAGGRPELALDFACAVEMLHTYSLIHDDLPCMDNDDLRRGKPTCHKVYGETAAVLAGDALQAAAFWTALQAPGPWARSDTPARAAAVLAEAAGELGMCLGQYWDTLGKEGPDSIEKLMEIDDKKTGDLFRAACLMGVIAAAGQRETDPGCVDAAMVYACALGLAFQIQDDLLDVTSTREALGKSIGSDAQNGKTTYVTLAGVEGCRHAVAGYTEEAKKALTKARWPGGGEQFLRDLADELGKRER